MIEDVKIVKTEILTSQYSENLKNVINNFIIGKKVLDIKFAINIIPQNPWFCALVMYEEIYL